MGFLKRFANSRIGSGSGDIILEEKDVPEHIKREKQALKYTREGYLDVGKSDLSLLSKPTSQLSSNASSSGSSGGLFGFLDSSSNSSSIGSPSSSSSSSEDKTLRTLSLRIEDNYNDVYKLMQRIELLEKKIERLENKNGSASSDSSSDNSQTSGFPGGLPF